MHNQSRVGGDWLLLQLVGDTTNRAAIGSQVRVVSGDSAQVLEVHSGRGYQSHFGARLHFGLGDRSVDRLEIRWHAGAPQVIEKLPANRHYVIRQGRTPQQVR